MAYETPWTYWAGDLRTGRLLTEVPVVGDSWSHVLNGAGQLTVSLNMEDADVAFTNPRLNLEPTRTFLAVERGGRFFQGGPVWTHEYDADEGMLEVKASNIWSYFDHRYIYPVLASGQKVQTAAPTVFSGKSLRSIASNLVNQAMSHTGGSVPLDINYLNEAGTETRTYDSFDLKNLGNVLQDLSDEDNGPDIRFDISVDPNNRQFVRWALNIGNPLLGQTSADWIYEDGANLRQVNKVLVNGATVSNRTIATGDGNDSGLVTAMFNNPTAIGDGYPLLESVISQRGVADEQVLLKTATGDVMLNRKPQELWNVQVSSDDYPQAESVMPGDTASFRIYNDSYLGSVEAQARILGISYPGAESGEVLDFTLSPATTKAL